MINLSEHRTALINLGVTINAIETLDSLIAFYSEDKPGPAYVKFEHVQGDLISIQIKRPFMLEALHHQRQSLVDYLATLGIIA